MSILFVWPAAIFSLLIWWTFFSGWSAAVRFGSVIAGIVAIVAFFNVFRLERFDGDMTPTRLVYRWKPSAAQKAREYLDQQTTAAKPAVVAIEAAPEKLEAQAGDWTGFRGPNRDGVVAGPLRSDWDARPPKLVWRHPIGRAWSSFAVVAGLAFTQEQRDDSEAVVAYQLASGQQVWEHRDVAVFKAAEAQGGSGPRATPQFDNGRLYTLGATGILNCLDAATGSVVWSNNILMDAGDVTPASNLEWGLAGSPLVTEDLVVVIPGGSQGRSVAAYDKQTGQKVWSEGKHPATYAGPQLAKIHEQDVVLAPLGTGMAGHSLKSGKELFFFPWTNAPKVCGAMPVALPDGSVLYGIGYGEGTVRLEITHENDEWSAREMWRSNRFRPKFNDFVILDGHAYGLDDGTLTCLDVADGKVKWKSGRYGYGQLLLVGETLLIVSEKGTLVQVPATPQKPAELASFQALDEEGITWNQPALAGSLLLIRNAHEAACYDLE